MIDAHKEMCDVNMAINKRIEKFCQKGCIHILLSNRPQPDGSHPITDCAMSLLTVSLQEMTKPMCSGYITN